jgi:heat shock protein HtpX
MKEKVLIILSLAAMVLLIFALVSTIIPIIWTRTPLWWYLLIVDFLVYIVSLSVLLMAGATIGSVLKKKVPISLDSLRASMISTATGILSGAVLVFCVIAYILGFEFASTLFSLALTFALIPSIISWLFAPAIINIVYRCRHDPELQIIVDRVAARAGMKPPKAMLANMSIPNAFAYSSPLMGRYVAVTTGLLRITNRDELEAVIGHELGHHKHRDNVVMMIFGLVPNIIYFTGRILLFVGMTSRYTDGGERRRSESSTLILLILGVILIVVSIVLQLLVLSLSRLREYFADAHGAKVTSPYTMINALKTLDRFYRSTGAGVVISNSRLKPLFIYAFSDAFIGLEELLATHPPIHKRIAFLESLVGKEIAV